MATIIEELLVTLNIDAEQFRLGSQQAQDDINRTRDAAHSAANDMASSGNTGSQFFSKMRNEAMMLMGLFTAGMGLQSFVKNTINSATQTGILADRIGLSTDRIKAFEAATERAGGSGQAMNAQLVKIADNAARIRKGESALNVLGTDFARFGGDFTKMLDPESAIAEYARIYQNIIEQGRAKGLSEAQSKGLAAQTMEGMGVSGDILPLLKQGNVEMQKQVAIQQQRVALSDKDAAAAIKAKQAWFDLTQQAEMFGQKVVLSLTPAMEKLTTVMASVKLPNGAEITKTIEEWTAKTESGIAKANEYAKAIGGFSSMWEMVGAVNKKVTALLLPDLEKVRSGFDLIRQYIPDPAELESIINRWNKKLEHFTDDFLTPANKEAGKFTKVLAEDWKKGFQGLLDLDIMSWTTKVSAFIDKIKELYKMISQQVGQTKTDAQSTLADTVGGTIAKGAAMLGIGEAQEAVQTNENFTPTGDVKLGGGQKQMMYRVYEAYKKAGLSDQQAKIMTAQVGRENSYNEKTIFGYHNDPARGVNLGMISWQGDRGEALKKRLAEKGLLTKSGMQHSQESIDEMAKFSVEEMQGRYKGSMSEFLENKNIDWDRGSYLTGKKYVGWAYGQDKIRKADNTYVPFDWQSHHAREKGYYETLNKISKNENPTNTPPPIIIPKGEKDATGKLKQPDIQAQSQIKVQPEPQLPQSAFVSQGMQTANNTQSNNITINVKSTDPKQAAHEIKTSLNEHLTTPFISNMISQ